MPRHFIESLYPLGFRTHESQKLAEQLNLRHSVELAGIKRVGIADFLRFFIYHPEASNKYLKEEFNLFVLVDLNDLVEIKLFPFWILTLKRLVDSIDAIPNHQKIKKMASSLFLSSIQSQDLFLTIDSIRQILLEIVADGTLPTIFFLRFDRLKGAATNELFANLQGLIGATGQKLCYVFTSFRTMDEVWPEISPNKNSAGFITPLFIKPALISDSKIVFEAFLNHYQFTPSQPLVEKLLSLSSGHVQYLTLSLTILHEKLKEEPDLSPEELENCILQDERINLQSEEIWESLSKDEQSNLKKITLNKLVTEEEYLKSKYLWDSGIVVRTKNQDKLFSPLLQNYLGKIHPPEITSSDLTKKESLLFNLLLENIGQVFEREKIAEVVWPEYEDLGVSDWTIDRLVARLRNKLLKRNESYSITTIRTRGYKLVKTLD